MAYSFYLHGDYRSQDTVEVPKANPPNWATLSKAVARCDDKQAVLRWLDEHAIKHAIRHRSFVETWEQWCLTSGERTVDSHKVFDLFLIDVFRKSDAAMVRIMFPDLFRNQRQFIESYLFGP